MSKVLRDVQEDKICVQCGRRGRMARYIKNGVEVYPFHCIGKGGFGMNCKPAISYEDALKVVQAHVDKDGHHMQLWPTLRPCQGCEEGKVDHAERFCTVCKDRGTARKMNDLMRDTRDDVNGQWTIQCAKVRDVARMQGDERLAKAFDSMIDGWNGPWR